MEENVAVIVGGDDGDDDGGAAAAAAVGDGALGCGEGTVVAVMGVVEYGGRGVVASVESYRVLGSGEMKTLF